MEQFLNTFPQYSQVSLRVRVWPSLREVVVEEEEEELEDNGGPIDVVLEEGEVLLSDAEGGVPLPSDAPGLEEPVNDDALLKALSVRALLRAIISDESEEVPSGLVK